MNAIARGQQQERGSKRSNSETCSFCDRVPASLIANLGTGGNRKKRTPLCWLHYYTSRAVRSDVVEVFVADENIQRELNESGVQDLFAEAYLELRHELATEAALSFKKQKADPLSILNNFHSRRKKPPPPARKNIDRNAGGFLPTLQLPERFQSTRDMVQSQQGQLLPQGHSPSIGNPYEKRKSSRKSIWKLAMENPTDLERETKAAPAMQSCTTCSCGSTDVHANGNLTSRNDVQKAETWGFKDRSDEVVMRYLCGSCGKTWNEEE